MIPLLLSIFGSVGGFLNNGLNALLQAYQAFQAKTAAAFSNMQSWIGSHANDGAVSVEERQSAQDQNAALDKIQNDLDNPTPVVVVKPTAEPAAPEKGQP